MNIHGQISGEGESEWPVMLHFGGWKVLCRRKKNTKLNYCCFLTDTDLTYTRHTDNYGMPNCNDSKVYNRIQMREYVIKEYIFFYNLT